MKNASTFFSYNFISKMRRVAAIIVIVIRTKKIPLSILPRERIASTLSQPRSFKVYDCDFIR